MRHILLLFIVLFSFNKQMRAADFCCDPCSYCGSGFQVYGEYLYWKAVQDGLQFASVLPGGIGPITDYFANPDGPTGLLSEKIKVIEPEFEWNSGFRVGLGYYFPCGSVDLQVFYTRLRERVHSIVTESAGGVIPISLPITSIIDAASGFPFGFANEADSIWKFRFETIDIELGKTIDFCDCVALRPFIGGKGACIWQKQSVEYLGFLSETGLLSGNIKKKNEFRGAGPSFGIDSSWNFLCNVSLVGGVSSALLYGHFDVRTLPELIGINDIDAPFTIQFNLKTDRELRIRPMIDTYVGLNWQACLCNRWTLLVGAVYELQYWWHQWLAPQSTEIGIIGAGVPQGGLTLQGLTVNISIAF